MQNALLSPSANDLTDPSLLVDGCVSVYRLNASSQAGSNILVRLLTDGNDARKLLAVKACIAIIAEGNSLPWLPSVSGLWRGTSAPIRQLLKVSQSALPCRAGARELQTADKCVELRLGYTRRCVGGEAAGPRGRHT